MATLMIYGLEPKINLPAKVNGVKSQKTSFFVIPAKAGSQCFQKLMAELDPDFRRGDDFLRDYQT